MATTRDESRLEPLSADAVSGAEQPRGLEPYQQASASTDTSHRATRESSSPYLPAPIELLLTRRDLRVQNFGPAR
jgi:hypothetical protein